MTFVQIFSINTIFINIFGYPMSYLEFFGTVFNLWCVWFAAKNKISNWAIGLVGIILYIFLFYQIRLYSDLFEQFYFLIMSFYGWWLWLKIKKQKEKSVSNQSGIRFNTVIGNLILLIIVFVGTFFLAIFTSRIHLIFPKYFPVAASYPFLDALTTIMSFVATALMAKKIIESWYLWILVDIIGVWLYYAKGVKFISLEYSIFLVMASYGLYDWLRTIKKEKAISPII